MAANEKTLGNLHEELARVLSKALEGHKTEGYIDPDTGEEVEGMVIPPSASVMTVAAKFLKDNEITCTPEQGNAMGELERIMAERRAASKAKISAADRADLADHTGSMVQ